MQVETSVQAEEPAVLDDVSQSLERPLILVTRCDLVTLRLGAVLLICHQDGYLSAQLRQLERT